MPQNRSADATLQRKRRHLLWRIHRRYQTAVERLNIGPLELEFTRIADPDVVLDEAAAEEDRLDRLHGRRREDELHLPYWAQLWDSGLGVGQWLVANISPSLGAELRTEARVLDLGCGMGLAGTVAARLGCDVTFADLEPAGLLFAALNSLSDSDHVRTRRLNWRTDELPERFNLILGADILYERAQWPHLERFWAGHLSEGGKVVLGEPGRQTGDAFLDWIRRFPWTVERSEQTVETRERPIRLLILSRK